MLRLVDSCRAYIDAVCREAELRERGEILGLDEYRLLRRENIALRLCFSLFEYCFGFDLPNEVFSDPTFMRIFYGAVDMIALANVCASAATVYMTFTKYPKHRTFTPTTWNKRERDIHVLISSPSS